MNRINKFLWSFFLGSICAIVLGICMFDEIKPNSITGDYVTSNVYLLNKEADLLLKQYDIIDSNIDGREKVSIIYKNVYNEELTEDKYNELTEDIKSTDETICNNIIEKKYDELRMNNLIYSYYIAIISYSHTIITIAVFSTLIIWLILINTYDGKSKYILKQILSLFIIELCMVLTSIIIFEIYSMFVDQYISLFDDIKSSLIFGLVIFVIQLIINGIMNIFIYKCRQKK